MLFVWFKNVCSRGSCYFKSLIFLTTGNGVQKVSIWVREIEEDRTFKPTISIKYNCLFCHENFTTTANEETAKSYKLSQQNTCCDVRTKKINFLAYCFRSGFQPPWESDKEIDWLDHHCLKASYELNIRTVLSNYLFSDLAMKEPIIQNETRCEF